MSHRNPRVFTRAVRVVLGLVALVAASTGAFAQTATLVPAGATWRYLDNGSSPPAGWQTLGFDDSGWASGAGQLGYGDGDEATVVRASETAGGPKFITTYFRRTFTVEDPSAWQQLTLRMIRDDGAVVYLNGVEILRSNMPGGDVTSSTLAATYIAGADESAWLSGSVDPARLQAGPNVLAVEIHQSDQESSDITFDLELGAAAADPTRLVSAGALWRYLDAGRLPAAGWQAAVFDDSGWAQGPAELGYGDGDESTVVSYGASSSSKAVTTYFRHRFTVASLADPGALTLRLIRDDGVIVYLNGVEVYRSNLPGAAVTADTLAMEPIAGADEYTWVTAPIDASRLVAGTNTIAVELHQATADSSDLSFDLELVLAPASPGGPAVVRGPYLQQASPTSVIVRWATNVPTTSEVAFGTDPSNLSSLAQEYTLQTDHRVTLTGLAPGTTYYYAVGAVSSRLAGGDSTHRFVTFPPTGTPAPTRVWMIADSGTADVDAAGVRDAFARWTGARGADAWLMVGDNAYDNGTLQEYEAAVFRTYPAMLRQVALWPALGNHDAASSDPVAQIGPYFQLFDLPAQGESGGVPSHTESYYSFDIANMHVVVLDSSGSDRSGAGPMATWLRADLAATKQPWIVAAFHHPPYSKGSHNSDTEPPMVEMRENIVPILEAYGVDLVLSGHSHAYERSFLLDGHYGDSSSFTSAFVKNGGNGREDGDGAYRKALGVPRQGTVYVVAGTSGFLQAGPLDHPAMGISMAVSGSVVIDVNGSRLDVTFIDTNAVTRDRFTIVKTEPAVPSAPANLVATAASASAVALTWQDLPTNESGFTVERSSGGEGFAVIATLPALSTSFTDEGLSPQTTYAYRVRAFNAAGASDWSNTAAAYTPAPPPTTPSDLYAEVQSSATVALAWSDTATGDIVYELQRALPNQEFVTIAALPAGSAQYVDTGLAAYTYYTYRVRAVRWYDASPWSDGVVVRTARRPAAPSGLTATAGPSPSVTLRWTDNSDEETAFEIQVSTDKVSYSVVGFAAPDTTNITLTGLKRGVRYFFRVRARRDTLASGFSNVRGVTTAR